MNTLMSPEKEVFLNKWRDKIQSWKDKPSTTSAKEEIQQSQITPVSPPIPPRLDVETRLEPNDIDLYKIWEYLNKKSLFVLSWGIRGEGAKDFLA